ncbi:MAG: cytochrome ubiquinol oxidase subunit [Actinomycetota bacterium]
MSVSSLDLARWQFGITTVYHFLFVPITIGTSFLVAMLQTAWFRTNNEKYLRATKFFGKLLLINFAMGVVTGIVQEFQFGMNWSEYSRFVGDIFGAPLAVEGLVAFFLESTFLGLWIFGWDRLPKKIHLATIWLAAIGTALSAYFILAANAFMQHPVGFTINPETNRAELTNFIEMLTQNTAVIAWAHTMAASFLVSGAFVAGISAYLLLKDRGADMARTTLRFGAVVTLVAGVAVSITGDIDSKIMVQQQPMKMAAAEGLYQTETNAGFSILTIGNLEGTESVFEIKVPGLLSYLSTGSTDGEVKGINDLQAEYAQLYGAGWYAPNIPTTYWSFRLMIGFGILAMLYGVVALWLTRKNKTPRSRWFMAASIAIPFMPLVAMSFGWIFTELGRQPWLVFGQLQTAAGVSPGVSAANVLATMIGFTLLYGILAVIEFGLLKRAIVQGPPPSVEDPFEKQQSETKELTFAY